MVDDEIGFKAYKIGDMPIVPTSEQVEVFESQKVFAINMNNLVFKPREPERHDLRWLIREIRFRVRMAWGVLRYGRDYYD